MKHRLIVKVHDEHEFERPGERALGTVFDEDSLAYYNSRYPEAMRQLDDLGIKPSFDRWTLVAELTPAQATKLNLQKVSDRFAWIPYERWRSKHY
jgi:hypothetical protein